MLRYALVLAASLCAVGAQADRIFLAIETENSFTFNTETGLRGVVQIGYDNTAPVQTWLFDDLEPADAGTTWTLDQDTAAGFGLNWSLWQDWATARRSDEYLSHGVMLDSGFGGGGVVNLARPWKRGNDLDHIDFTLVSYTTTPDPGGSTQHTARSRIEIWDGPLEFVPEPSALVLLIIGLLMLHHHTPKAARR